MSQDLSKSSLPMMHELFENAKPKFDKDLFYKEAIDKAFDKEKESDQIISLKVKE